MNCYSQFRTSSGSQKYGWTNNSNPIAEQCMQLSLDIVIKVGNKRKGITGSVFDEMSINVATRH